jgi:uncharacterized protein YigA (DUF484 family)
MSPIAPNARRRGDPIDESEVAAFLCRHPDFFERHPEILSELAIPHPDRGQAVSLLERQLAILRQQRSTQQQQLEQLILTAEQNEQLQERLRTLFLALAEVADVGQLLSQASSILMEEFDLVCVILRILQARAPNLDREEVVAMNDSMQAILNRLESAGGFCDDQLSLELKYFLFGEQARNVGSIAIVGILEQGGILALGAREPERYQPGTDTTFLKFVGAFISATCRRTGIF